MRVSFSLFSVLSCALDKGVHVVSLQHKPEQCVVVLAYCCHIILITYLSYDKLQEEEKRNEKQTQLTATPVHSL